MSKKAQERALEAYPPKFTSGKRYAKRVQSEKVDTHVPIRTIYLKGYVQAEKDLGWKSVDESLPPMGEEVIVLTNVINGRVVDPARYICFGHIVNKEYAVDYDGWNIPGVKYWMPFPELEELK